MARTYEPIASTSLGSAADTVTFSSIPGTYTDLVLVINAQNTVGAASLRSRFNGDTGTNFSDTRIVGNGSSASSARDTSDVWMYLSNITNEWSTHVYQIMSYSSTNVNKTTLGAFASAGYQVWRSVGLWRSTAAVTSITLNTSNNFSSGSTFSLYGIKAA